MFYMMTILRLRYWQMRVGKYIEYTLCLPSNPLVWILQRRGANIYAEFLGGSFTCDAYHMTEPHPDGNK